MNQEDAVPQIDWGRADLLIELALNEDLDTTGDVTTASVVPEEATATAVLRCKEPKMVLAGIQIAERVFKMVEPRLQFRTMKDDGDTCEYGEVIAEVSGPARGILVAERTALNFLQRLCGVATTASKYAAALEGTGTEILDTRKTTPGYRNLEKYAVAVGGATNHRIGLYDRVMIKDNHRELAAMEGAGGIARSVGRARAKYPELEIEVEADSLDEVREADLLLHVVDISHPSFEEQIAVVKQTLQEIGAGDKPVFLIFNKIDAYTYVRKDEDDLTPSTRENLSLDDLKKSWIARANTPCIFLSARKRTNIDKFRRDLYGMVREIHAGRYPFNNFLY